MSAALWVTQFRWRTFPVAQRVTTNLFVDKVDRCTLELRMETESISQIMEEFAKLFQLFPPKRISERIVEQIVDSSRVSKRTSQVGCCAFLLHGGELVVMYTVLRQVSPCSVCSGCGIGYGEKDISYFPIYKLPIDSSFVSPRAFRGIKESGHSGSATGRGPELTVCCSLRKAPRVCSCCNCSFGESTPAASVGVLPDVDRTLHRYVAEHYLESAPYTCLWLPAEFCARVGVVSVPCRADGSFDLFALMSEQTTYDLAAAHIRDSSDFRCGSANVCGEFGSTRMAEVSLQ